MSAAMLPEPGPPELFLAAKGRGFRSVPWGDDTIGGEADWRAAAIAADQAVRNELFRLLQRPDEDS